MRLVPKLLPAVVLGGAGALVLGYPASAAPLTTSSAVIGKAHPVPRTTAPRSATLFTVIGSTELSPSQTQIRVVAHCPKGTVPFGGGVFVGSSSPLAGINDSFPSGNGWVGDVNNSSGATTNASAAVLCGAKPAHYKVVKAKTVKNPSGRHTVATATCPAGTKPIGGGASASSQSVFANLAATLPQGKTWRVDENNASAGGNMLTPFAICAQVPGYHVVVGPTQALGPNTQTFTTADCPSGLIAIGGGGFAGTSSVGVNLNETAPGQTSDEWVTYINNASGVTFTGSAVAVCAAFQAPVN
jgi:hypothetical protein